MHRPIETISIVVLTLVLISSAYPLSDADVPMVWPFPDIQGTIHIDGEEQLEAFVASMGFGGDGTEHYPYRIADLIVDAGGGTDCLFIKGVQSHIVIEDCMFLNASSTGAGESVGSGLCLADCSNVTIDNITASNCRYGLRISKCERVTVNGSRLDDNSVGVLIGSSQNVNLSFCFATDSCSEGIMLIGCNDTRIVGNTVLDNDFGIYAGGCTDVRILNNTCIGNDDHGIRLDGCTECAVTGNVIAYNDDGISLNKLSNFNNISDNRIRDCRDYAISIAGSVENVLMSNIMTNCSIYLIDRDIWNHQIDSSNTVNGGPVVQLMHFDGRGELWTEGGQLFLYQVRNITFAGMDLSRTSVSVLMYGCANVSFDGIVLNDVIYHGMIIWGCSGLRMRGLTFSNTLIPIEAKESSMEVVSSRFENAVFGIDTRYNRGVRIAECTFASVDSPVVVTYGNCEIANCSITGSYTGIYSAGSNEVLITGCTVMGVGTGIAVMGSVECTVKDCIVVDIGGNGIILKNDGGRSCSTIVGNVISNVGAAGLLLQDHASVREFASNVESNRISKCMAGGLVLDDVEWVEISDNYLLHCNGVGIDIREGADLSFHGNVLVGCILTVGEYRKVERTNVTMDNTVDGLPMVVMVRERDRMLRIRTKVGQVLVLDSTNVTLEGPIMERTLRGIDILKSVDVTLLNASVIGQGIHCYASTGYIRACEISSCSGAGITLDSCSRMTIEDSAITGCISGILFKGRTRYCSVLRSNISGNSVGILVKDRWDRSEIFGNFFLNNTYHAIKVLEPHDEASSASIDSNLFAFNNGSGRDKEPDKVQAFDPGNDRWANNYWLDHTDTADGADVMSEPYFLGGGAADWTPLRRIPAPILPPPDANTTRAMHLNDTSVCVEWKGVSNRSMIPVRGYVVRARAEGVYPVIATAGADATSCYVEKEPWEYYSVSTISDLGESVLSEWIGPAIEYDAPLLFPGVNGTSYWNSTHISFPLIVREETDVAMIRVLIDDERTYLWSRNETGGAMPKVIIRGPDPFPSENTYSFNVSIDGLSEGTHRIFLEAKDHFGNIGWRNLSAIVDLSRPSVRITNPLDGSVLFGREVDISFEISDRISGIAVRSMDINGRNIELGMNETSYIANLSTGEIAEGGNVIVLRAIDRAGNEAEHVSRFILNNTPAILDYRSPVGEDVKRDAPLIVHFSRPIKPNTLTFSIKKTGGENFPTAAAVFDRENMGFMVDHDPFDPGTEYAVHIRIDDEVGNRIEETWSFRTREPDPSPVQKVRGRVLTKDGRPLVGVDVLEMSVLMAVTDLDGGFDIALQKGEHWLTFRKPGFKDHRVTVQVDRGEVVTLEDIVMELRDEDWPFMIQISIAMFAVLAVATVMILYIRIGRRHLSKEE